MDWPFTVRGLGDELITRWDARRLNALPRGEQEKLQQIVDRAGLLSAKAQGLGAVITDISRVKAQGHVLYLVATKVSGTTQLQGLLKVGMKKLFIRVESGAFHEMEPLCVLDFYVHESMQRAGLGRQLMETMLQDANLPAHACAYDRPSPKLLQFLKKHYGLANFIPQSNNFVVFKQYFSHTIAPTAQRSSRRSDMYSGRAAGTVDLNESHPYCSPLPVTADDARSTSSSISSSTTATGGRIRSDGIHAGAAHAQVSVNHQPSGHLQKEHRHSAAPNPRFGRRASPVPLHYQTLWGSGGQAEHSPASGGHAHGEMRNPGSGLQRVAVRCTEQDVGGVMHAQVGGGQQQWKASTQGVLPDLAFHSPTQYYGDPVHLGGGGGVSGVSPAKAIALRHRAGVGAKNALAW